MNVCALSPAQFKRVVESAKPCKNSRRFRLHHVSDRVKLMEDLIEAVFYSWYVNQRTAKQAILIGKADKVKWHDSMFVAK